MKKLTRLQKLAIVMGILLIGAYVVAPAVGAHPTKDLGKIIDKTAKAIKKIHKSGEITKAHEAIEKAFQKFKENPRKYGVKAAEAVGPAGGISMIVDAVDKSGIFKTYEPVLIPNDDDQCIDIYVEGERVGTIAYKRLANLNEDEMNTTIKIAADVAIDEYQKRHESNT